MKLTHLIALPLAVLLTLAAGAASATEATSTTWLNVRSGPGSSYAIVDTLEPGEVVEMTECQASGWCYITHPGPDGWVNSTYLTAGPGTGSSDPDCRVELTLGPDGPDFRLICGGGAVVIDTDPDPTPSGNRACFFDGPNFTGASFCRQVGVYNSLPAAANDRITSVRLYGAARVRLCDRQNMRPFCRDITSSTGGLGGFLNNKTSSLRVYTGSLAPMRQACLFDGANYTGQYLCYGTGTRTLPPAAQNRATSIRLFGPATIRVCKGAPYPAGPCATRSSSWPAMPPFWNNQTRSLRIN